MRPSISLLFLLSAPVFAQPGQPSAADRARALKTIGEFAREYVAQLPNFVCLRVTQHYMQDAASGEWKPQVKIGEELTFYEQSEHYRIVAVNEKPASKMPRLRSWVGSAGDFGDFLHAIFAPKSRATLAWKSVETLRGRQAWTFSYRVPKGYLIADCGTVLIVSDCKSHDHPYHGTISVSADSLAILRLTVVPEGVPKNEESRAIDYDGMSIAGEEYRLPISDTFERVKDKIHFRNESTYRDYRKFAARSDLTVEDGGK